MLNAKNCLLACAVLIPGVIAAQTAAAAAPTFIYDVTVKTSFGTKFHDCFTFHSGKLVIAGLGTLIYSPAPTMPKFYYTAVTQPAVSDELGAGFAFSGFKKGTETSGELRAVGADSVHDSYNVHGVAVSSCSTSDSVNGSAYKPAAQ